MYSEVSHIYDLLLSTPYPNSPIASTISVHTTDYWRLVISVVSITFLRGGFIVNFCTAATWAILATLLKHSPSELFH
jgi:hypothetical protein